MDDSKATYDRAYRAANRERLNEQRRKRRQANPNVRAREKEYREANRRKIAAYRKSQIEKRAAHKRAYRQLHPGELLGFAHRTNRDLVRSGVLSFSRMRNGGNEIADDRLSVLDEIIAREDAIGEI